MENLKIRTYGIKELSERVQKELFRLGYEWIFSGEVVLNTKSDDFIYIIDNEMCSSGAREEEESCREITLYDLEQMKTPGEKKIVRYYGYRYPELHGITAVEFYNDEHEKLISSQPALTTPIKVCPDTQQIYIEIETDK
jgi:hypothetical protein